MEYRKKMKWVLDIVSVLVGICILAVMIIKDPALHITLDKTVRVWSQSILCALFMFITYVAYVTSDLKRCENDRLVEAIKASTTLASFMWCVLLAMTMFEALPIVEGIL